jgi:hypothetical protein
MYYDGPLLRARTNQLPKAERRFWAFSGLVRIAKVYCELVDKRC